MRREGQANAIGSEPRPVALLVEDDPDLGTLYQQWLELDGFDVVREQRGETAWRLVNEVQPTVVVTDHRLPEGTGLDLMKRIRMNPGTRELPVILITAFSNAFIERTAQDTPLMELITKPTRRADFVGAVHRLLEEKGDSGPTPGRA